MFVSISAGVAGGIRGPELMTLIQLITLASFPLLLHTVRHVFFAGLKSHLRADDQPCSNAGIHAYGTFLLIMLCSWQHPEPSRHHGPTVPPLADSPSRYMLYIPHSHPSPRQDTEPIPRSSLLPIWTHSISPVLALIPLPCLIVS